MLRLRQLCYRGGVPIAVNSIFTKGGILMNPKRVAVVAELRNLMVKLGDVPVGADFKDVPDALVKTHVRAKQILTSLRRDPQLAA